MREIRNLAGCREKNNQLASAWGLFLDAERQTRSATDTTTQQLHGIAQDRAQRLEPRLSTLTISVSEENRVGGLEIVRNNEVVDVGTFNRALPIDGGIYTISARAPGNAEWSKTVTVGRERDAKTIEVPKLKVLGLEAPIAPSREPAVLTHVPQSGDRQRLIPLGSKIAAGVTGAGLVTALILTKIGLSAESNLKTNLMGTQADADEVERDQNLINIAWGITGAAAVTAVLLYIATPTYSSNDKVVVVAPTSNGGWAASLSGHF